eukprot:6351779-Karenia_brevis.AAC.1
MLGTYVCKRTSISRKPYCKDPRWPHVEIISQNCAAEKKTGANHTQGHLKYFSFFAAYSHGQAKVVHLLSRFAGIHVVSSCDVVDAVAAVVV